MALSRTIVQLLMGLGVGLSFMVVVAISVFVILVYRRKYLHQETELKRNAVFGNWPHQRGSADTVDMSRSVAYNRRSFHTNDRRRSSTGYLEGLHDPTLRPLHGYNDPYYHRERTPSSRDVTPRGTNSSRNGIAVVPFRESTLPSANASFSPEGHIRTSRNDGMSHGSDSDRSGRGRYFPGARSPRVHRPQYVGSDQRSNSNNGLPRISRATNASADFWTRDDLSPRTSPTVSSRERASNFRGYRARSPPSGSHISGSHIEFPRDSSHLNDVYY